MIEMSKTATLRRQIQKNYDAFQRVLSSLLPEHHGEFALLRHGEVVGFYSDAFEADQAGSRDFTDQLYSIQQIDDEPVMLGIYANGAR